MISQILIAAVVVTVASASLHYEPVHHHAPKPYKFGYSVKDKHGEQHREESGNGGNGVVGSYGFTDARGIHRQVNYVADHAGFRAQVKTNEPGTANQNPAAVQMVSDAPYAGLGYGGLGGAGLGYGGLGYGAAGYGGVGYGAAGYGGVGYGAAGYEGLGYGAAGYGGLGYGAAGLGYEGVGGYGGLRLGILGGLGYARYGY